MIAAIARFELRYQLRAPVFWVPTILFFLLTFACMTVPTLHIGAGGNVHANSPVAVAMTAVVMSMFFMFLTAGLVANVVVRDDDSGFAGIVRSTPVAKSAYMLGRFAGAAIAAAIALLAVPLAMALGTLMPWLDPETLGPNHLTDYLFAYGVLALPNILITSAIFFALACVTRSMTYSYLGVVVVFVFYTVLIKLAGSRPELRVALGYADPFGMRALGVATRYSTAAQANGDALRFTGLIAANRLIWLAIGAGLLALTVWRFRFAARAAGGWRVRRRERRDARHAAVAPRLVDRLPAATPDRAGWTRLAARTRFEMVQVFRSPAFLVILLLGLAFTLAALLAADRTYGIPIWPRSFAVIGTVKGAFGIVPLIVAIYYAGEVVWRDRERRINEIVDATSLPNWAYMIPKALAVAGVMIAMTVVAMAAAVVVQLVRGVTAVEPGQWLGWFLLPFAADLILLAVLAVFVQALSPNKFVGWAIMVLYVVATISLDAMGFEHPLYVYGSTGLNPLSDLNGAQVGGAAGWWLRLYWGAWALALATLAHLLWRRGTGQSLKGQWRTLPRRLRGPAGVVLSAAVLVAVLTGGGLLYQMNVLNRYRTSKDVERDTAAYERKYLRYERLPQPTLTDVRYDVQLFPAARRVAVSGTYRFVNATAAPIRTLHVRMLDRDTRIDAATVPGATLLSDDRAFGYRIFRFDRPLAPGGVGTIAFRTSREQRGLRATGDDTHLVANGTFLQNFEFAPVIGMNRQGLLSGRTLRRKYGLPPELRPAKLEDLAAQAHNDVRADWVRSDITLSTDADQTPIAPGVRVADTVRNGRRTSRFVSRTPIIAFFSIQSARYASRTVDAGGIPATVFFDPRHAINVDRMLAAVQRSLAYYRASFGPYQFPYARIVEFPGYASFAQSFAGTIPYSERIGFILDVHSPEQIDYVSYVTAHELAHQYWAHQLSAADMQGSPVLSETLSQYSALMVMKHLYGDAQIRKFLRYEVDAYLSGRGTETTEELPLGRVERQPYIYYRKGAAVMYLLQDRLGESRVNRVLADLLVRDRFKAAPYARSADLVTGLLGIARTLAERQLVHDMFDRITLYDLKALDAHSRRLADGRWETLLTVNASKSYAGGDGAERAAPLADMIDIGVFARRPGAGGFSAADVVGIERRSVRSGRQRIRLVTRDRPAFAGIDPYNKYIDRVTDDNIVVDQRS